MTWDDSAHAEAAARREEKRKKNMNNSSKEINTKQWVARCKKMAWSSEI